MSLALLNNLHFYVHPSAFNARHPRVFRAHSINRYVADSWATYYHRVSMAPLSVFNHRDALTDVRDRLRSSLTEGVEVGIYAVQVYPRLQPIRELIHPWNLNDTSPAKLRGSALFSTIVRTNSPEFLLNQQQTTINFEIEHATIGLILDHAEEAIHVASLFYQHVFKGQRA